MASHLTRKPIMLRFPILLLLCMAALTHAETEPAERGFLSVAVMPFTSSSAFDSGALQGLSSAMGTQLVKTGKFRVLERAQMDAILREQGLQQSGACDGGECAIEVGKLLSVDRLVVGHVAKVGNIFTLSARLVSVESGVTERSVTRNGSTKPETVLTRAIPLAAKELAGLPTPTDKEIAERGRYSWIWWAAGGTAIAGGAVAAVVMLQEDGTTSTPAPAADQTIRTKMP